jgi:hypothetical protein
MIGMRLAVAVSLAAVLIVAGVPAGAVAATPQALAPLDTLPLRATGTDAPLGDERLSNETTLTRYAHANWRGSVRSAPDQGARTIAHLRFLTEDGPPETYLVLRSHVDDQGRTWLQIRIPGRPNGRTGWVGRDVLSDLIVVRTSLRVNRRTLRATLYKNGKRIWSSRIGVGKRSTPTPAGRFWIRTRLRNLRGGTIYGPWAFGTADYSVLSDWPGGGVIGIHGTNQPQLIPGRPSHGCIRVPNRNITRLARLMPIGTPVQIL